MPAGAYVQDECECVVLAFMRGMALRRRHYRPSRRERQHWGDNAQPRTRHSVILRAPEAAYDRSAEYVAVTDAALKHARRVARAEQYKYLIME